MTGTCGPEEKRSRRVLRGRLFSKGKIFNDLSLFYSMVYLFFQYFFFSIAILFAVRYQWDVCNEDKCCVVTHHAADFRAA